VTDGSRALLPSRGPVEDRLMQHAATGTATPGLLTGRVIQPSPPSKPGPLRYKHSSNDTGAPRGSEPGEASVHATRGRLRVRQTGSVQADEISRRCERGGWSDPPTQDATMLEEGSILSSYHGSHATIPSREPTHADEPSEPFPDLHALTQAHSRYHSCTDNTHSGRARPRYIRPHTERSSPFQALPLLVSGLKYPGPRKYSLPVVTSRPTTYVPRPDRQVRRPYRGSYKHTHLLVRRMDFGKPQPTNIPKRNYRFHDYLSVPP